MKIFAEPELTVVKIAQTDAVLNEGSNTSEEEI